jgi:hypothetical protein
MNLSPTVLLKGSLSLWVCLLLCFGAHTAEGTAEIAGSIAEATSDSAAFANVTFVHAQTPPPRCGGRRAWQRSAGASVGRLLHRHRAVGPQRGQVFSRV